MDLIVSGGTVGSPTTGYSLAVDRFTLTGGTIDSGSLQGVDIHSHTALDISGGTLSGRNLDLTLDGFPTARTGHLTGGMITVTGSPSAVAYASFSGKFDLGGTAVISIVNSFQGGELRLNFPQDQLNIQPDWTGSITQSFGGLDTRFQTYLASGKLLYNGTALSTNPSAPDYWGNTFRLTTTSNTQSLALLNPVPEPTTPLLAALALATALTRRRR